MASCFLEKFYGPEVDFQVQDATFGIGLQVVEAMTVGTPVEVSDLSVMRKLAADAPLLVQLQDIK